MAAKLGRDVPAVGNGFMEKVVAYGWPGNIRELENAIERAVIRAGIGGLLTAELLEMQSAQAVKPEMPAPVVKEIRALREVECDMIVDALAFYQGNIQKAAAKLGIGRNTLYRKMKEFGISF